MLNKILKNIIAGLVWLEKEVIPFGRLIADGIAKLWTSFKNDIIPK